MNCKQCVHDKEFCRENEYECPRCNGLFCRNFFIRDGELQPECDVCYEEKNSRTHYQN